MANSTHVALGMFTEWQVCWANSQKKSKLTPKQILVSIPWPTYHAERFWHCSVMFTKRFQSPFILQISKTSKVYRNASIRKTIATNGSRRTIVFFEDGTEKAPERGILSNYEAWPEAERMVRRFTRWFKAHRTKLRESSRFSLSTAVSLNNSCSVPSLLQ